MGVTERAATAKAQFQLYIDGEHRAALAGRTFESVNPTTGKPWADVAAADEADVNAAVAAANTAFRHESWYGLSPTRRGRLLMRWGDLIGEHAEEIAELETRDNGKLYREMVSQLRVIPDWLYYYGGLADKVEGRVIPLDMPAVLNYTLHEPLGVVAVIVPWNSPTFLALMGVAPALAAGNTVVVKPSEITSPSMVRVAELATRAGFPPGVVNVVTGAGETGRAVTGHPRVAKVTFTGGTATGSALAEQLGKRLARYTLELGGKSPNIVFQDADTERALAGVFAGIFAAAGQTCIAGSRALIHESLFDSFVWELVDRARVIRIGDPLLDTTQMGPLATASHRARVDEMVTAARADGAEVLHGGHKLELDTHPNGYFYAPTIVRASNDAAISQEEVFGPVLTVIPFRSDDEAVELANATRFGLAAGVWTKDVRRAHTMASRLEAGIVWLNTYRAEAFNSPFGGYKASGVGRANGEEAIYEYLQTKSVWCDLSDDIQDPFVARF
jgi:aldehyde dehydrogenase (NAD+)